MKKALLLAAALMFISAPPAHVVVVFSDDFSGGLEKWQTYPGTSASGWSVTGGRLTANITSKFTVSYLVPRDQFWDLTWHNYRFSFDYTPQSGSDKNFGVAFEDQQNSYDIHFYALGYEVTRIADEQVVWSFRGTDKLVNGRSYRITLEFANGVIRLYQDDVLIFDLVDPTFDGNYGRPALKATTGAVAPTKVVFDNVEVELLDENNDLLLPVPLFKQTDPAWTEQIYDTAQNWAADPTIGAWGCAVTSAAMIFRYHGISQLPDGSELTPATLNSWLNSQPDGYIGQGLTNWLALTRLSKLMRPILGTPSLIYQRVSGSGIDTAAAQLSQSLPAIIQIPGHFFVAKGINGSQNDLIINDPAYNYDHLSQHSSVPVSTRIFTPADQSARFLLFAYEPETQFVLLRNGSPAENLTIQEEMISIPGSASNTEKIMTAELPDPTSGLYSLTLTQAELGLAKISIFSYSADGEVQKSEFETMAGPEPMSFDLYYSENGSVEIQPTYSWEHLLHDVELMFADGQLTSATAYFVLTETAAAAAPETLPNQLRYISLFEKQLSHFKTKFLPDGYGFLAGRLEMLKTNLGPPL